MRFWNPEASSQKRPGRAALTGVLAAVIAAAWPGAVHGSDAQNPARRTELVKLVERLAPSVVNITTFTPRKEGGAYVDRGTGAIIHRAGYILTNSHVAKWPVKNLVTLRDKSQHSYRLVAAMPSADLALIKIDTKAALVPVKIGRSNDLMIGEPVLVIGNPRGHAHSVTRGIVSAVGRRSPSPQWAIDDMIQTDAPLNPGNSGGPLFNAVGEQIGVVAQRREDSQGIGYAIPIDLVRRTFPAMLAPEMRFGFFLGAEVDAMGSEATVTKVLAASPAEKAGIRQGDVIRRVGKMPVGDGFQFYLSLIDRLPGRALSIEFKRGAKVVTVSPKLARYPTVKAAGGKDLKPGIHYEGFLGNWEKLPNLGKLTPAERGLAKSLSRSVLKDRGEWFALRFTGYLKVPADGAYTFFLQSDDGSRLHIGRTLVVDNSSTEGLAMASGMIRLEAGHHPLTVSYLQRDGHAALLVSYEGPKILKQEIPAEALFHRLSKQAGKARKPKGRNETE